MRSSACESADRTLDRRIVPGVSIHPFYGCQGETDWYARLAVAEWGSGVPA